MPAAFVQALTAVASNKAAGTTLAATTTVASTAGNLIVGVFVFDNAAVASKPIVSGISKPAGETANWLFVGAARSTSTTAGAFASGETWCIKTTVAWPTSTAITVTLDTSTVMKSATYQEFSGTDATLRSTTGTAYSTTTTAASATTTGTTPQVGDLALGLIFGSNVAVAQAGDTDTTGGSWSTPAGVGSTGSGAATNNFGVLQYKILTGANHQTLNNSAALTAGNGSIVAILQATIVPAITQASYRLYADGTESGSTALAAQDTAYTANMDSGDVNLGLRTRLQSTNAGVIGATDDWQLQWEKNASGTWANVDGTLADSYAGAVEVGLGYSSTITSYGQSFLGNGQPVTRVGFVLRRTGAPTGNATAQIYAHTGAFGTSGGLPTGSPLTTSAAVAASSFPTVNNATPQFLVFDGTFTPTNGTPYVVTVTYTASDASNFLDIGKNNTGGHAGTPSRLSSGVWGSQSGDFAFELYTISVVAPLASANLTDAAATTNRLGAGTGSFVAGKVSEDGLVDDLGWTANNYTELLYSITLKAADFANGDTLRFRVLRNGATTGFTYTQTPTINVTKTVPAVTQAAYRFYADGTESGSTALAAQDTAYGADVSAGDVGLALRTRLQSTNAAGPAATDDWQLQVEKNASGTWAAATSETLADSYDETNADNTAVFGYAGGPIILGQSFTGNGGRLMRAGFYMNRLGAPVGAVNATLYAHSGTFGTSSVGGAGLTSSTTLLDAATISTSDTWVEFAFDGTFTLAAGTNYVISLEASGFANSSNCLRWRTDASSPTHAGNSSSFISSWAAGATIDRIFRVYTGMESASLTDGSATTNRLGAGSGSFVAGKVSEDGLVDDLGWTATNYTELLYWLTLQAADLANGDTLRYRVLRNGATTGFTYTQTPTINVTKVAVAAVLPVAVMRPTPSRGASINANFY